MNEKRFSNPRTKKTVTGRRGFLAKSMAAALGVGITDTTAMAGTNGSSSGGSERLETAKRIRVDAAAFHAAQGEPLHPENEDQTAYPRNIASFSKTLPHGPDGEVDANAFGQLKRALSTGEGADFATIPMGGSGKLINPRASFAFQLEGADPCQFSIPAAPSFNSAECAGEMVELYWQALTRDIPFAAYDSDSVIAQAARDVSRLSAFRGPKASGIVTPATIFRGSTAGELIGPYLSQFLIKPIPVGASVLQQQFKVPVPGLDYLVYFDEWLANQNGVAPTRAISLDPQPRYIRNGRDLAWFVHHDFSFQIFLSTALMLTSYGTGAIHPNNPYLRTTTEAGFATFGAPNILDMVVRAANYALRAAWFQKWAVHMRLRPEVYAARVHQVVARVKNYPVHPEVLRSDALTRLVARTGSALLPLSYPEGSPAHPAYPSGHATIAGACVTMLKAFFNEDFLVPSPSAVAGDGLSLLPYAGNLRVGDELNKLASNVAIGRNAAGVHYRSDAMDGLRLGEDVAIEILRDTLRTFREQFSSFTFRRFDGTTCVVMLQR